jgi:hypothetical protein
MFRTYLKRVLMSLYSQFLTPMNASGSMQQSEKPNSSPEPPQAEPPVSGWPEWVGTWPTWGTDEDDQAVSDILIIHFNFD